MTKLTLIQPLPAIAVIGESLVPALLNAGFSVGYSEMGVYKGCLSFKPVESTIDMLLIAPENIKSLKIEVDESDGEADDREPETDPAEDSEDTE